MLRFIATFSLIICCGCGTGESAGNGQSSSDPTVPGKAGNMSQDSGNENISTLFGDGDLRGWPQITGDSIGNLLTPDQVKAIYDGQGVISTEQFDGAAKANGWRYDWQGPDSGSGTINVETVFGHRSESEMNMTVASRRIMVGSNELEEVDLSEFGVKAYWYSKDRFHWLEICTRNQLLKITTNHMFNQGATKIEVKRQAAITLAKALFESASK